MESIDIHDLDSGVGRYASTNRSLTSYMEKIGCQSKFARRRASSHVSVGLLLFSLGLDGFGGHDVYQPVAGGHRFLTDQNCFDQSGYDVFEVRESRSPGLIVFVSRSKMISLLVFLASHPYMNYQVREKKQLSELLQMKRKENSSVFCLYSSFVLAALRI